MTVLFWHCERLRLLRLKMKLLKSWNHQTSFRWFCLQKFLHAFEVELIATISNVFINYWFDFLHVNLIFKTTLLTCYWKWSFKEEVVKFRYVLWEGHKIWKASSFFLNNLVTSKQSWIFFYCFWGLLRISEL